jgi:Tfp pilus assembly protein PilF/peroxiredoxin
LACIVLALLLGAPVVAAFKHLTEGMDAPDFTGTNIVTGEQVNLIKLRDGHLVIVVFWSTWSPRSFQQLSDLARLLPEYSDHPVRIIAVNVDAPELTATGRSAVVEKVEELNPGFPVIIDEGLEIFYRYGVIAVPSTAVVDSSGVLRYGPSGYSLTTRDYIVDSIESFLGLRETVVAELKVDRYRPKKRAARYFGLAVNLKNLGMYERALANLDSSKSIDTLFAAPHALEAEILLRLDRISEAVTKYEIAVRLDSSGVAAWAGWGRALMADGQREQAMEKLSRSLELEDTYTPALLDMGLCMADLGQLEKAIDTLAQAAELNRGDAKTWFYLGRVYRKAGHEADATAAFLSALAILYPDD